MPTSNMIRNAHCPKIILATELQVKFKFHELFRVFSWL